MVCPLYFCSIQGMGQAVGHGGAGGVGRGARRRDPARRPGVHGGLDAEAVVTQVRLCDLCFRELFMVVSLLRVLPPALT